MALKGLGKGLGALLADIESDEITDSMPASEISIDLIDRNENQPRKIFDEVAMTELVNSIRIHGIITPLILVKRGERYMIIAGERRWRAAKRAGLRTVPAIIRDYTEAQIKEISLIENIQRENLNPIEKARGLRKLLDDYGLTQQELADKLGMSRSGLTNNVRILNLDPRVIDLVLEYNFSERQCRELMKVQDPDKQYKLAMGIVKFGDKSDEIARKIENEKKLPKTDPKKAEQYRAIYQDIENSFQGFFGSKVKIEAGKRKGKIVIEYNNNDDLERILALIK